MIKAEAIEVRVVGNEGMLGTPVAAGARIDLHLTQPAELRTILACLEDVESPRRKRA